MNMPPAFNPIHNYSERHEDFVYFVAYKLEIIRGRGIGKTAYQFAKLFPFKKILFINRYKFVKFVVGVYQFFFKAICLR